MRWEGPRPPEFDVIEYPQHGMSNHARARGLAAELAVALPTRDIDCVVGFNRMPGLDIYYAADPCYSVHAAASPRPWLRWSSRHNTWSALEAAVFGSEGAARILTLTAEQERDFAACYGTDPDRFRRVPLPLSPDRGKPVQADAERAAFRAEFGLEENTCLLLAIGSSFATKGLDRTLRALADLQTTRLGKDLRLFVVGEGARARYWRLARRLRVQDQVQFFGGRADVGRFLLGADLLVHPARRESGGIVLLEALAAGLPVITTASCGFAPAVAEADAGTVLEEPFDQAAFAGAIAAAVTDRSLRSRWSAAGSRYGARLLDCDVTGPVVDQIESIAALRPAHARTPPWQPGTWVRSELQPLLGGDPFLAARALEGERVRSVANRRTLRFAAAGKDFFLKWHGPVGWREIWKNLLVGRAPVVSARNEYETCRYLAGQGISAPSVAAFGCRGRNPARRESFVVLDALTGRTDLERIAANGNALSADELRALVEGVARFARRLHEVGVAHRDFYLCHLLLDDVKWARGEVDIAVLDLHRARIFPSLPVRWRERDLAALLFSSAGLALTPRLLWRFVYVYSGGSLTSARASLGFWNQVMGRAVRLELREARRAGSGARDLDANRGAA